MPSSNIDPTCHHGAMVSIDRNIPAGCESVQPVNVPPNADTIDSKVVSPDMSPDTSNVQGSTDLDMDEERDVDAADEVQADGGPRMTTGSTCDPILPMDFEGDVARLKARLLEKGANGQAVELCDTVFEKGVTIEALEERMTREQCDKLKVRDGKQFRLFLACAGKVNGRMTKRHRCRLCSPGKEYKNHRDALRHLLKDHFGLGFKCGQW